MTSQYLKTLRDVCHPNCVRVMNLLIKFKRLSFSEILTYSGMTKDHSGHLSYVIRKLKEGRYINNDNFGFYEINKRGKHVLKMIETVTSEKFITDDPKKICHNNDTYEHKFIQICQYCGVTENGN